MAAPNIVNVTAIYGKTTSLTPANTTANVLLANAANSNKVLKINSIIATNIDGSVGVATTVSVNTSAAGSGTSFPIASTIPVPQNAALVVLDKSTSLYLEENSSLVVTSGVAGKIAYVVSYEEIS